MLHWKPLGRKELTLGIYVWGRGSATRFSPTPVFKRGVVFRLGPLGHVQGQVYRVRNPRDGRVPRASAMVSWWGVKTGRRKKRYVEIVGR